jgi:diphosphomevalonate decarboxylase
MKATAKANANIALVKYWGKRNKKLILPYNSSISMTCDGLFTISTVEFSDKLKKDLIFINDKELEKDEKNLFGHLEKIRQMAGIKERAKVVSQSNFPLAAGLAGSASGLAAITVAAVKAAGLNLDQKAISILARQGSGSACRSIFGGFVEWLKGKKKDGSDSYGVQIVPAEHWPEFRLIVTILSEEKKKVGSRLGMAQTVETCPYYENWLKTINQDLEIVRKGILDRDFTSVGSRAEHNCLKMHALMMTTSPAIIYWRPETLKIIQNILNWREGGLECYFTIDAGPQVKIICLEKDGPELKKRLQVLKEVKKIIVCRPGQGTKLIDEHLF